MLESMHVRNFALIEKADLELGEGLNILTGETGAGKSILIDAMNIVLGGKCNSGLIRKGAESAYVELVFHIYDEAQRSFFEKEIGEPLEEGTLILSRRITPARSVFKLNDATVTASKVRNLTAHLIDIHGQHEHQSLMHKNKHLDIVDAYAGEKLALVKAKLADRYRVYQKAKMHLEDFSLKEEDRLRELDFLKFEINEITSVNLKENEEAELEVLYKRISNSRDIMESMEHIHDLLGYENSMSAGNAVSDSLGEIHSAIRFDPELQSIQDALQDLESILSDLNREISAYMDGCTFDEETYHETARRLDEIRNLEMKYGRNYNEVMASLHSKELRLQELEDYEKNKKKAEESFRQEEQIVISLCNEVSELRKEASDPLIKAITESLLDLNFLQVKFDICFTKRDVFGSNGFDEAEFLLSTNPGQSLQPMAEVASGGELSRIMLAVKTVLADTDQIPTLIFDEIDTGISGRTAACVADKLELIAEGHQVICITHLPQIASRAKQHFMIEKGIEESSTITHIHLLTEEQSVEELARMLGGTEITQAALDNARALKHH